jgi:PmbA protein
MNNTIDTILEVLKKHHIKEFEIDIAKSIGTSTAIRLGELENISNYQNQSLDITIYQNGKSGHASSADLSKTGIENAITSAKNIANFTQFDEFQSLAPKELLAFNPPDLDMFHPWELHPDVAIDIATQCENAGRNIAGITNSDGSEISSFSGTSWYINSHGLVVSRKSSSHSLGCSLIAERQGMKETSYYYHSVLDSADLLSPQTIGKKAATYTLEKLGGGLIPSGNYPIIFSNKVSSSIIGSILGALSGGAQYKKASFLAGTLDTIILPQTIDIIEQPLTPKTIGSKAYDDDGVLKKSQYFVKDGKVQNYILGQYSANQLQMQTTGNAGGVANVVVPHTQDIDLIAMQQEMHNGIIIDELMGQGINGITGDYSRGAGGFLVQNGEITQRISGITIAGNLKEMLKNIAIIGNDSDAQKNIKVGSILISNMMVAGA